MAITSTAVWELRSTATAANANGGFYKPGATGTDFSQQDAAQFNLTGCTSAGANAIILNANAAASMVGNGAHVISGTNATPGWYEITAVSVGVSITVDSNWCTGIVSSGVVNIGGAISLNSSTANQTDSTFAAAVIAGNTVYVKGTPTVAATCTFTNGVAGTPIQILGYQTSRGDNPTGTNRPTINCSTFTFNPGGNNITRNFIFTGSAANVVTLAAGSITRNCKFTNTSTTAARAACNAASANTTIYDCEAVSYRGNAFAIGNSAHLIGCYAHDSNIGITLSGSTGVVITDCIVESCVAQAINNSGAGITSVSHIIGNTFYGGENKTGVGIAIVSGTTQFRIFNNIIYGFTTGISDANAAGTNYGDFNLLNNNTANYSNITAGASDITTTPGLASVAQITGTNGTVSGSVLTSSGADFSTVTANRDFCYIVSGTGATVGQYKITAATATTLTLDIAPGDSAVADKVFQVTTGRNFKPGVNARQVAFPGAFQAGLTTSYLDIGGVQRDYNVELPATSDVRSGTSYASGSQTGSLTTGTKHLGASQMG